jgi:hypothetical protein
MPEAAIALPGGHTGMATAFFAKKTVPSNAGLVHRKPAQARRHMALMKHHAGFMRRAGRRVAAGPVFGRSTARFCLTTDGNRKDCKGEKLHAGSFFHLEVPKSSLSREVWVTLPPGV